MILLDTNVISALMLRQPPEVVIAWLDGQVSEEIWTTSISVFEIRFGLELMEGSQRRRALEAGFHLLLDRYLTGRVALFDQPAAEAAAELAARRRRTGRSIDMRDTQIAGIAIAQGASIATRNIRHFEDLPVPLLDPWNEADG